MPQVGAQGDQDGGPSIHGEFRGGRVVAWSVQHRSNELELRWMVSRKLDLGDSQREYPLGGIRCFGTVGAIDRWKADVDQATSEHAVHGALEMARGLAQHRVSQFLP